MHQYNKIRFLLKQFFHYDLIFSIFIIKSCIIIIIHLVYLIIYNNLAAYQYINNIIYELQYQIIDINIR